MVVNKVWRQHNFSVNLKIGTNVITAVSEVQYLGVIVDENLTFTSHINNIVLKASVRANVIKKCFISRDIDTLIMAFNVYVRPLLEYETCIWSPYLISNINLIESVQRRFTKALPGLYSLSYDERLSKLSLESLESRRLYLDLVMAYKIIFWTDRSKCWWIFL